TLETRDAKHEPRSVAQQRATWAAEAAQVLGGRDQVAAVVKAALAPAGALGARVDAAWVDQAAAAVLDAMQTRRATWQVWHVKAEALRVARAAELPAQQVPDVVDLITDEVLTTRCIRLTRDEAGLVEPAALRRRDGSSAYTVAGAQLYSSPEVLSAEQSLLRHAGTRNGTRIPAERIEVALLEVAATGPTLNDGQAAMVRAMATSGARLQLAIAPAGSGKTTAMGALTQAWTAAGGTVLGLAPSAAAAGALRKDTGATTDTMAKLTWALSHDQPLPQWAETIGPRSLVIIDEAGMADTLSLAQIADFVIGRGGSIRLIGDTQQLAAIGAGGILRDIETTHGALRLHKLVRFTDPAEAAASLALRDGGHEALGFYLDRGRVHVGDPATTIDTVFGGWARDVDAGRDAVMLA
ncbi:MAG: AAA family ATPase, partial [Austwickia sp.]|nr:AAA family ATPase [Austwickia sp.]